MSNRNRLRADLLIPVPRTQPRRCLRQPTEDHPHLTSSPPDGTPVA